MSMKTGCEFERAVMGAVKAGTINNQTAAHIKSCANCRETVKITRFLQAASMNEQQPKKLPAAGFIWFRYRLREKQRAADIVTKPILFAQMFGALIAFTAFVWLMLNRAQYSPTLAAGFERFFDSMQQVVFPLTAGVILLSFICTILILTLRRFYA